MPSWWKRSKTAFHRSATTAASSAPASPARASTSRSQPRRAGAEDAGDLLLARPQRQPRQLTRQRKLRHVYDIDALLADLGIDVASSSSPPHARGRASASDAVGLGPPISRSSNAADGVVAPPPRSASSPVLHPLPLPSPSPKPPAELETTDPASLQIPRLQK
ncbi:hypothetical protein TRIUR3_20283 [Triticum urartu]|uniref:Uncharacterized protein n=1 Tax=Triticum urartu TaxID=4572 RepID=M8ARQ4_TRIUA|nr:hypothetical protein TRIUR3_20283 [Triticum urartu]